MDATIQVDAQVRDRLAVLAQERGMGIRDLVAEFAWATPTREELGERAGGAEAYLRGRLAASLGDHDLARAESVWAAIEAGDVPESLTEPRRPDGERRVPGERQAVPGREMDGAPGSLG